MHTSRKHWDFELAALLACTALAHPAAAAESLCAPHEPVVFACQVGDKLVSLCRPASEEGVLSYRFGRPQALELRYPEPGRAARAAFTVTTLPLIGGGETTVSFRHGGLSYTVYSKVVRANDTPLFEEGVLVARRGKVVRRMHCEDGGGGFSEPLMPAKLK